MTFGFLSGSRNFCKLLWVSCQVLFLHGYAWIHWVAKSCTTIAYRWLFRDSQLSLGPCGLLLSSHRNLQLEVRLRHCVFCIGISPTAGEEGEDEEDEDEWLSCFIGVREDDEEAEEELVKPGTTMGTKFSVLQIIWIPSSMRCVFWPLIHSKEYPFSSQSFPSDNTAGVLSRTFIVKNFSNSFTTYTVASSCVCNSSIWEYVDHIIVLTFCGRRKHNVVVLSNVTKFLFHVVDLSSVS